MLKYIYRVGSVIMNSNVCSKCGAVMAPGVKFCASCGTPVGEVPAQQPVAAVQQPVAQVTPGIGGSVLIRRKSNFFGCAVPLTVTVDGSSYTFNNGNEFTFNLTPGVHVITWKFWSRRLQQTQVTVVPGGTYLVELVYDWLWGGFKLGKDSKIG